MRIINYIKSLVNEPIPIRKGLLILLIIFLIEIPLWHELNYYHRPNELALGNMLAFLIFVFSCIGIVVLIQKKNYKLLVLISAHLLGLFFIDRITLDNGWKRFLDATQQTWEFQHVNQTYMVVKEIVKPSTLYDVRITNEDGTETRFDSLPPSTNDNYEHLTIYKKVTSEFYDELMDPILSGECKRVNRGFRLVNDSTDVSIYNNYIYGFPTKSDSMKLRKVYW